MTASSLDVFTLDLKDTGNGDPSHARVSSNFSFELVGINIQTLWANNQQANDIEGLLYVPDPGDNLPYCSAFVPSNVTRITDIPPSTYRDVAIAPFIDTTCVRAYLQAAQMRTLSAFIFFLPALNDTNTPPPVTASVWDLSGDVWSGLNNFPIYAIPGAHAFTILQQLSLYSGPIFSVPNSDAIQQQYGTGDSIRLYANFKTSADSHYPTLWAFLLIILGIVVVLLAVTSFSMRFRQRRNRNALRQRILDGQVDLEILGLKKPPRMSQADVDALPQVTYDPLDQKPPLTKTPATPSANNFNQVCCAICLEDYVANDSTVRVLPCHHIYHPECIDPHLLASSSLCPLCKARVPTIAEASQQNDPNYTPIPPITNAMVRRERYVRQMRERGGLEHNVQSPTEWFQRRFGRPLMPTVGGVRAASRRQRRSANQVPTQATIQESDPTPNQLEMGAVTREEPAPVPEPQVPPESIPLPPSPEPSSRPALTVITTAPLPMADPSTVPGSPPPQNPDMRREWARRRASLLMHRHSRANPESGAQTPAMMAIAEQDEERRANMPAWRRGVRTVFPGYR